MKTIKVGDEFISANELFKFYHAGARFICGKCDTPLISAFTRKDANEQKISPGIYCPKNFDHVNIHFNLRLME